MGKKSKSKPDGEQTEDESLKGLAESSDLQDADKSRKGKKDKKNGRQAVHSERSCGEEDKKLQNDSGNTENKKKKKKDKRLREENATKGSADVCDGIEAVDDDAEVNARKSMKKRKLKEADGPHEKSEPELQKLKAEVSEEEGLDKSEKNEKKKKKKKKQKAGEQESEPAEQDAAPAAVAPETPPPAGEEPAAERPATDEEPRGGTATKAFQRVREEEWIGKKGSWDNSYTGTFGAQGWGYKAQEVLGKVRGKDFRHEKTKKKRGSYRGGKIELGSNSFKFESDDEE